MIKLTGREKKIMQLVANGFTASEIAQKISFSRRTVEYNILTLRKRLRSKSVTHLAIALLRANIIK